MARRAAAWASWAVVAVLAGGRLSAGEMPPEGVGKGERGPGVPAFYVREGFRIDLVSEGLREVRFLEFDDQGNLFVSQPGVGSIVLLHRGSDGKYTSAGTLVTGRRTVHGMFFYKGWLWFTQSGAIHKIKLKGDGTADGEAVTVVPEGQLPSGGGHWWRSILVTDQGFYTSIGDSGNITDETASERQKIWKFDLDGSNKRLFASGLRNTEKLRLRPGTQEVWGCDHGSDNFGASFGERRGVQPITDRMPPDKVNHYVEGGFYGHPFLVGSRVPRAEFQNRKDLVELAGKMIEPAWPLGAHWAPNAFTFLSQDYFPGHKGDMLVALHGSWNSSERVGYGIERIMFDPETGRPTGAWRLVTTLGSDGRVLARPCDCAEAPDGSVLFSDDQGRRIFRLSKAQGK